MWKISILHQMVNASPNNFLKFPYNRQIVNYLHFKIRVLKLVATWIGRTEVKIVDSAKVRLNCSTKTSTSST